MKHLFQRLVGIIRPFVQWAGAVLVVILFTAIYLLLFAPVALWFKVRGRRFLPQFRDGAETYYVAAERVEPSLEWLRRQG